MDSNTTITEPGTGTAQARRYPAKARTALVTLTAIAMLGTILRVVALGHRSFWLDEISSVAIVRMPGLSFWRCLWQNEGNMALYYILLRGWLHLGVGEATVRSLSVIPGIAAIPLMYLLAARLFQKSAALVATLFMAMNACAIAVSEEARAYSFLVLGVLASTYVFVRLIERPTYRLACGYGLVAALTLYFHYFAALVPAAHLLSLVALPASRRPWKQLWIAAGAGLLVTAPVLWMINAYNIHHLDWVGRPSLLELYHLGAYLAAESGKKIGAALLVFDLALIFLFLRKLKSLWRERELGLECWRYALIASGLFAPIVLTLLVSFAKPIFSHRFLVICLPAWILMSAVGARDITRRGGRTAAIAAIAVLSLASSIAFYTRVREDWRGMIHYLMAHADREDRVLYCDPVSFRAAESYRDWLDDSNKDDGNNARPPAALADWSNKNNENWERQTERASRVWLVLYQGRSGSQSLQAIEAKLQERFTASQQINFGIVTITEYRHKPYATKIN